ncbi:MAG: glycosyltransferase family 2 protein [Patescibacteria group bacterium]
MAVKISALILTKNEEDLISDAINQLDFVDEIIVLDQSSQDKTVERARKFTDKIARTTSEDFAKNRNLLASHAKGEWLLYVDCDERLTESLAREIQDAIKNSKFSAYYIPRQNFLLGKWQKHGGWWPDYVPRLIKRKSLIAWQGKVHESPKIEGESGYFKNPLVHLTARSMSRILEKSIKWAKIEAQLYHQSTNPKVTIVRITKGAISEFISRYFLKLGFLDGTIGAISAIYQSLHRAMIFTYLWELQNDAKQKFAKAKSV